jgi:Mn-dependent DtxR family transcriptional regulator
MKIQASAEDYLEAIYVLSRQGRVRSVDIAKHMGFAKPSVSVALRQFRENGYVEETSDRSIVLTEKGAAIAQHVHERHTLLTDALVALGVSHETAVADACKIEHVISTETFEKIRDYFAQVHS